MTNNRRDRHRFVMWLVKQHPRDRQRLLRKSKCRGKKTVGGTSYCL